MKKLLKKIILLCILGFFISYPVDYLLSIICRPGNTCYAWNDIYENRVNSELVIFGSSRAIQHFDSQIIEDSIKKSVYNLGLAGARIDITYLRLLELQKYCTKLPSIITLELSCLTLENNYQMSTHHQLFPFMLFNKNIEKCTKHLEGFSSCYYYLPLIRYYGYFNSCFRNSKLFNRDVIPSKGYWSWDAKFNQNDFEKKTINKYSKEWPIDSFHVEFLDNFVSLCKQNNIKLNFVYTPEYYKGRSFFKNREEVLTFFQKYADSLKIPFKDFSNDSLNYNSEYFRDVQHLNKKGAEKFTSEYFVPWIKELYRL